MKYILLTQGKRTKVDNGDYALLSEFKWYAHLRNGMWRVVRTVWHPTKRQVSLNMANLIMLPPSGYEVDHINGNGLDNQRHNLRICTHAENTRNRRGCGASGYKGVTKHNPYPGYVRWRARVAVAGRTKVIGYFHTPKEAARAYDREAKRMHGKFAWLNHA